MQRLLGAEVPQSQKGAVQFYGGGHFGAGADCRAVHARGVDGAKQKEGESMKILVACEESQAVTKELRKLGHEAYSCDIEPCSGGHPEWHIQGDVLPILDGWTCIKTADETHHEIHGRWDMLIAFPPCTYLTSAGTRHYSLRMNSAEKVEARIKEREQAVNFFMIFANADCPKIAIENPVGYMNTHYRKPNQIVHPYWFGDNAEKRTCLWLKGLPELEPTEMLPKPEPMYICQGEKCKGKSIGWCEGMRGIKGGQKARAAARSKTFPGIAKAIAEQWAGECI